VLFEWPALYKLSLSRLTGGIIREPTVSHADRIDRRIRGSRKASFSRNRSIFSGANGLAKFAIGKGLTPAIRCTSDARNTPR
jgi:hypothetical protein